MPFVTPTELPRGPSSQFSPQQGRFEQGRKLARGVMQAVPHVQSFAAYIANCVAVGDLLEAKKAGIRLLEFDPSLQ
ncbi:hypothetical protein [Bradyrhizobium sp. 137]|uniref:hypothetical protein n=1 Tax=Bradyrhizobium sp. 137 TaxID=2782614 RepID=UPI001FF7506A|nr:hypothetical protein [Bradyrhizobium sp. 137]